MVDWQPLIDRLAEQGVRLARDPLPGASSGGDNSMTWRSEADCGPVFLKICPAREFARFEAEAEGLAELAKAGAIRVPQVLASARTENHGVLALEWLALQRPGRAAEAMLGTRLAAQHRIARDRYGWHRDNSIGRTPQINTPDDDWASFFRVRRLGYQLDLAACNGYQGELQTQGRRLAGRLEALFDGYRPPASLLHGDLWGGNWGVANGDPVVFDPAVYYGDRETDLAMTRLFGGFGEAFYRNYQEAWPLESGHRERQLVYQLYHVLNHLNLFGGGYHGQALSMLGQLKRL